MITSLVEERDVCCLLLGAPVAQWVKRWPADLDVSGLSLEAGIFSIVNGVPLHTAFHYHPPNVLIWMKYCLNGRKIASHPSILAAYLCLHVLCFHILFLFLVLFLIVGLFGDFLLSSFFTNDVGKCMCS